METKKPIAKTNEPAKVKNLISPDKSPPKTPPSHNFIRSTLETESSATNSPACSFTVRYRRGMDLVDLETLVAMIDRMKNDVLRAVAEKREDFVQTYLFGKVIKPTLNISSTFTANSILSTLSSTLHQFSNAKVKLTYNDFSNQLLNPQGQFHQNKRGVNILLFRFEDFRHKDKKRDLESYKNNLAEIFKQIESYSSISQVPLIVCSCPQPSTSEQQQIEDDFLRNITQNKNKLAYVVQASDIHDFCSTANPYDEYAEKVGHIPYTPDYFDSLGRAIARIYYALSTSPKKVIVVDCDDTLWKGKVGEDGVNGIVIDEQRKEFQKFLVEKSQQGFLVCLCSRNNEPDVWAVFEQRQDMVLKKDDIANWRINWKEKSKNISDLSQELGLAQDSMIFIDDDPAQVAEVSLNCPEVLCLQLPKEDELIPYFFHSIWGLESFGKNTNTTDSRTKHYQHNRVRNELKEKSATFNEFLEQLELKVVIRDIDQTECVRVAELMKRSTQFNFNKWSPEECTDARLRHLIDREGYKCLVVDVKDRYDDYGLVGLILYRNVNNYFLVESFILSCRALGKGVEHKMLNELGNFLTLHNQDNVYILFKDTQKNAPAQDFLAEAGFKQERSEKHETLYSLPASTAKEIKPRDWEQKMTSSAPEDIHPSPPLNQAVVEHNSFIKRMITSMLEMQSKEKVSYSFSSNSVEDILNYFNNVINLSNYFGNSPDKDTPLVALGFDSLLAVQFVSQIHKDFGISLDYTDLLESDATQKKIATLISDKIAQKSIVTPHQLNYNETVFPLSHEQQRLWSFYKNNPNNAKYNISTSFQLDGNLNPVVLEDSFRYLLKNEPIFSLSFEQKHQEAVQTINFNKSDTFQFEIQDAQGMSLDNLKNLAHDFINLPFRLEQDLLLRVQILKISETQYILTICIPHIIHDAFSLNLLLKRLAEYYSALSVSTPNESVFPSYLDYVNWQKETSSENVNSTYWQEKLVGKSNTILPIMKKIQPSQKNKRCNFTFDKALTKELERIALSVKATSYHTILSVFNLLLSKYSGKSEVLVLTPTMGRQHPNTDQIIGFFVNLVLINSDYKEQNFYEAVSNTQSTVIEALKHQDYSMQNLLSLLDANDSNNLLPISFVFQNYEQANLNIEHIMCKRILSDNNSLLYDMSSEVRLGPLAVYMNNEGGHFNGLIEYDESLFTEESIQQFIKHFQELASKLVTNPETLALNHSLLTADEEKMLLDTWSGNEVDLGNSDIISIFKQQVGNNPPKVAIKSGECELSYAELDDKSTQFSTYLHQKLVLKKEDCIAICLPRNHYEAIAILGILKAGCAYVPINPKDPDSRIEHILKQTSAKALIIVDSQIISIDTYPKIILEESIFNNSSLTNNHQTLEPNQLVYIMFTSGSTGNPKGVLIEQQGIKRLAFSPDYIEFKPEDRIAQVSNSSFDAATFEFWGGLLNGATLVYPEQELLCDIKNFPNFLLNQKITVLFITTALFEAFSYSKAAIFKDLNYLLFGGEFLNPKAVELILSCAEGYPKHLLHCYGPTENTAFSTIYEIKNYKKEGIIPIGAPINQTQVYVLDAQFQPVPVGVPGFLYLGGSGLARGYLNLDEVTRSKFFNVNILGDETRLYATGDLVQWLPDGNLGYIGRIDNQIKLRGHRVDLRNIEETILSHPSIKQAIIVAHSGTFLDQKKLILYFVPNDSAKPFNMDKLKKFLKEKLPAYMLPEAYFQKTSLPITPNGKIDRNLLLRSTSLEQTLSADAAAQTNAHRLQDLIIEIVGLPPDSILKREDNLYELGINSISLIRLSQRINEEFDLTLPAYSLMNSSFQQLLELVEQKQAVKDLAEKGAEKYFIQVQAGNPSKLPIIFIHPAGGSSVCYRELLSKFEKEQPCYVIEDPSIYTEMNLWNSLPEMAACYLGFIKKQKPEWEEIILSGWSLGGMVAVEMALQSQAATSGMKIKSLVLLDTWVVSQLPLEIKTKLKEKVVKQHQENYEGKAGPFFMKLFETRQEQGFSYAPKLSVETPIFLCKAKDSSSVLDIIDNSNFWSKFAPSVEVEIVSGDHDTILSSHAVDVATKITNHMKAISKKLGPSPYSFWCSFGEDLCLGREKIQKNNGTNPSRLLPTDEKNRYRV